MKRILTFCVMAMLCLTVSLTDSLAATLHIVIVTDSDPRIGSSKDKVLINDLASRVSDITNMALNKHVFSKNDTRIVSTVKSLNVGTDDVIWFYYSGHGRNSGDGWPMFVGGNKNYKLTAIHEAIKTKAARLKIVMFDCCNIGSTTNAWSRNNNLTPTALGLLFQKSRGTIMVSGADAGQFGYGSPNAGGLFTTSFIESLGKVSPNSGSNIWKQVLTKTRTLTNQACQNRGKRAQNPIFDIRITGDDSGNDNSIPAPEHGFGASDAF